MTLCLCICRKGVKLYLGTFLIEWNIKKVLISVRDILSLNLDEIRYIVNE